MPVRPVERWDEDDEPDDDDDDGRSSLYRRFISSIPGVGLCDHTVK